MSFLAHEENGLFIKTSTVLSDVRHGFSTRIGGVSPAPWDSLNLGVGRGTTWTGSGRITAGSAPPWGWMSTGRC